MDHNIEEISNDLLQLVADKLQSSPSTEKVQIFGSGHRERLSKQWGIDHTFSVPLLDKIAANGDSGLPFVLGNPDSPQAEIYKDLAKAVVTEVAKVKYTGSGRPNVVYNKEQDVIEVDGDTITPANLRRSCRCAACVEEMTGRQLLVPSSVPESIGPLRMYPTGNYALSVDWSDGHRSLYPHRQIRSLLEEQKTNAKDKEVVAA
jgi:DUF971 family protein